MTSDARRSAHDDRLENAEPALFPADLLSDIRAQFLHTDQCPVTGADRAYPENGGGSLRLKSAMARLWEVSAWPDQEGRRNAASAQVTQIIEQARADIRVFLGAETGAIVSGETGSECINKLTRAIALNAPPGPVLSSPLEHPATFDTARLWAERTGRAVIDVPFDIAAGAVTADHYAACVTPDAALAMIVHTSQTTGLRADLPEICRAIRAVAPDCFILADGVQHAAHEPPDVEAYGVDAYVFSPYKVFMRSGKGFAWVCDRLARLPHDKLAGAPADWWDFGGRDAGLYAGFSEVVRYLDWLGGFVSNAVDRRARLEAAGRAMRAHELALIELLLHGNTECAGLLDLPGVTLVGEPGVRRREAVTAFRHASLAASEIEERLEARGVRTVSLSRDVYSRHVLEQLDIDDCVRATVCHYNTPDEILRLLTALGEIVATA